MRLKPFLFILLVLPGIAGGAASPLAGHLSPYLAMHANDPVQWRLWDDAVLRQARRENKLIFVSSGYFSCHWCHVMQRESFHNEAIAALLNRVTIPVKIDRELSPGLDSALLAFVERTRGAAGWPLNVFLTPEGYPLVGTVYLPPDGFVGFVEKLEQRWNSESEQLAGLARRAAQQESKRRPGTSALGPSELRDALGERFRQAVRQQGDHLAGGRGDGAKFPDTPLLEALLLQPHDESLKTFTLLTLEQMASQGLRDHLGGGFFRYTVDPNWQQPHFEKMLSDNAQLVSLYLHAAKQMGSLAYRELALQTLDFMLREMWHPDGAFITGLSAVDEAGAEGGHYLWTHEQLRAVLTDRQYQLVSIAWVFHGAPEWMGGVLPIPGLSAEEVAERTALPVAEIEKHLLDARQRLLWAREQRSLPRDDKRLAGWNGLALSALSEVREVKQRYFQAGVAVRDYLHTLWDGERLWRIRAQGGRGGIPGALEDYVYAAQGLLDWANATGDRRSRELVTALVTNGWQRFHDEYGWHRGEGEAIRQLSSASPMLEDGQLPSASALWLRLNRLLGEQAPVKQEWYRTTLLADPERVLAEPLRYPSYLLELEQTTK